MSRTIAAMVCGLMLAGAGTAAAQGLEWNDKGFVNVNVAFQPGSQDVTSTFSTSIYGEQATIDATRHISGNPFLDVMAGGRVWKNFGAGMSFGMWSHDSDGTVTGSIPDPAIFDKPRTVVTTVGGMKYQETLFSVLALYGVPVTDKIDVIVFLGPMVRKVSEDVITGVLPIVETASGPTLTIATTRAEKSLLGVQVGADVRYLITKMIGVGAFLRINTADGTVAPGIETDLAKIQAGGGLRIRF